MPRAPHFVADEPEPITDVVVAFAGRPRWWHVRKLLRRMLKGRPGTHEAVLVLVPDGRAAELASKLVNDHWGDGWDEVAP